MVLKDVMTCTNGTNPMLSMYIDMKSNFEMGVAYSRSLFNVKLSLEFHNNTYLKIEMF